MDQQPVRVITVRDPNRPDRPADLLTAGDERPPLDPATRRRRLRIGIALLLVAATVVGGAELRDRRAAAAEERRLDGILDLRVEGEGGGLSVDDSLTATLEASLRVYNAGPRDLVVLGATVAGYELVPGEVPLDADGTAPLLLQRTLTCSTTTPPSPVPGDGVELELRTPLGPRSVRLPLPADYLSDEAARACGFMPVQEAVAVQVLGADFADERLQQLRLEVDVSNRSVRPVTLLSLEPGLGLRGRLSHSDGSPAPLPLELPTTPPPGFASWALSLLVDVTDCASAREALQRENGAVLTYWVRDEEGQTAEVFTTYELYLLRPLVDSVCSPG